MKRRYIQHMNSVRPSAAFTSRLEREMNHKLHRSRFHRSILPKSLTAVGAIAAAIFVIVGIGMLRFDTPDVISQPPVIAPGSTSSVLPESTLLAEPDIWYELPMLDEAVPTVVTDINYYYGCYPLMPYEKLAVHKTASLDSSIIDTLLPGTVFWTDQLCLNDGELREIRWYDAASASMKTGWAGKTEPFDGKSSVITLSIPGRVTTGEAIMRHGANINAPEITVIPEGQLLHLCYRVGNWIFASTAPFDQVGENAPLPIAGWIGVENLTGLHYEDVQAAETPQPTITPSITLPPENVRLELEMSDEGVFLSVNVVSTDFNLFQDYLAGSSTHGAHLVEIHQSEELNSVVIAPLQPGTAYWPMTGEGNFATLTNQNGKEVGYAQRVKYLDEESNTLKEGWKHVVHSDDPLPETPDNPVEEIQLPGRVKSDSALIRYGRSAEAPVIASLPQNQLIAIGYRVGNWLYISTEPFCMNGETPAAGWIHITEAVGTHWRSSFKKVNLTAATVNLRQTPDGKKIATLDKDTPIIYGSATVPGKTGNWHYVYVGVPPKDAFTKDGFTSGYISADYAKLNTFRLESELSMDDVVSATLAYSDISPFGAAQQTVDGEKLDQLLERLKNACSESVYTDVCGEGAAVITLHYADGNTIELPISADSCTQVRYGDVIYDLRTDAERTEAFLNDGGLSLSDILSPIFDEIKIA